MKLDYPIFKHRKDLYDYIALNKIELLEQKKFAVKFSDSTSNLISVNKSLISNHLPKDKVNEGVIYRTIIGNTYYWMDSHDDVHLKGIFTKSINENKKIRHTHDHVPQITAKVGTFTRVYEEKIAWKSLGINKEGFTYCLLADSQIEKAKNEQIFTEYLKGEIDQHSVEMYYLKMDVAINDKDYADEYKNWNAVYPLLGNKEKALENGFFFTHSESKLKAISCVIEASNELTGTFEPSNDTQFNIEPRKSTQGRDYAKLAMVKYL
jgi:hypothetical protein